MSLTIYEVSSSVIHQLGYDSQQNGGTVEVQYKDKHGNVTSTWQYSPVDRSDFEAILNAPSVGSAVIQFLKKGPYSAKRIG